MDPNAAIQLGLTALQYVLQLVGELKAQHGLSDDDLAAHVKTVTAGNDALYAQMIQALGLPPDAS